MIKEDNKIKLSIIICVFNTERKLFDECLNTITSSTLLEIDGEYEICIVDDGSRFDYSDIAKRYGARLKKTQNQGIFSAREAGLAMSKGEYIAFCDSDDTVSFDYHLPMLELSETSGADIVIGDWATHTPRARYYFESDETISEDLDLASDEKLRVFFRHGGKYHSFYVLWNKLYKKELLIKCFRALNELKYPKSSSYAEDVAINFFAWKYAKRVKNIHTGFYFYRIHPSQSVNAASKESLLHQVENMQTTLQIMKNNVGENLYKTEISEKIEDWKILVARWHASAAKAIGHTELLPIIQEKYRMEEAKILIKNSSDGYSKCRLLGTNFEEIDEILFGIWKSDTPPTVKYDKSDRYVSASLKRLVRLKKAKIATTTADVVIPKAKKPIRQRLLLNPHIYRLGERIFKKGSKVRAFLKKFI